MSYKNKQCTTGRVVEVVKSQGSVNSFNNDEQASIDYLAEKELLRIEKDFDNFLSKGYL
tara:strand:+ start:790 stop:966 length:177 start_codon:yes stop_codon:yes gene_type:complete